MFGALKSNFRPNPGTCAKYLNKLLQLKFSGHRFFVRIMLLGDVFYCRNGKKNIKELGDYVCLVNQVFDSASVRIFLKL